MVSQGEALGLIVAHAQEQPDARLALVTEFGVWTAVYESGEGSAAAKHVQASGETCGDALRGIARKLHL